MTTTYLLECLWFVVPFLLTSLNKFAVTLYACGICVELWPVSETFSTDRQDSLAGLVRDMDILDILIYSSFPSTYVTRTLVSCVLTLAFCSFHDPGLPDSYTMSGLLVATITR